MIPSSLIGRVLIFPAVVVFVALRQWPGRTKETNAHGHLWECSTFVFLPGTNFRHWTVPFRLPFSGRWGLLSSMGLIHYFLHAVVRIGTEDLLMNRWICANKYELVFVGT